MKRLVPLLVLVLASILHAQQYTRGIGVYPGDPNQFNGASMVVDTTTYRNLALHHPAYQSSAYDYNLTAQLVTDGVVDNKMPRWIVTSSSEQGVLPRSEREHLVDSNPVTAIAVPPTGGWVQLAVMGGDTPEVDRVEVTVNPHALTLEAKPWSVVVLTSEDGAKWTERGRASNTAVLQSMDGDVPYPVKMSVPLTAKVQSRFYRFQVDAKDAVIWSVGDVAFYDGPKRVQVGGQFDFRSAWKSASNGEEWVYVDLGAESTFDRIVLSWILRAEEGAIQVSNDAKNWQLVQALPAPSGNVDNLSLKNPVRGRYVRVLMTRAASPEGYILSELEVYGRGGTRPQRQSAMSAQASGRLELARGEWRLQRDSLVTADGPALSQPGFHNEDWLPATVPGTVLSSYLDCGAIPDPNYGNNQLTISESFFYADFWYRNEVVIPAPGIGKHVWLNFDGVNWKAEVFFNGEKLGRIDGGFTRARFDVTRLIRPGAKNAIAVLVRKNASPGAAKEKTLAQTDMNGGAPGADNPTFHASIGWDWIPTIRGRNTGIWGPVYLTNSGAVTIEKPFVRTTLPLPSTSRADVAIEATLHNHDQKPVKGILRGKFGDVQFAKAVTIPPATTTLVRLDPSSVPALRLQNPKLWWPAGYGEQNLYPVQLSFETTAGVVSDKKSFQTGVRQFTYSEDGGALRIWINGRRFVARGGNWGFSESMLRYRGREYDTAMRLHQDMNFTMVRNWVGQIGDDAFFEAADKHGIVIWQDFWLANPWDGPDPDDNSMFMQNATDFVERIRNHPSIGLYCGRNEGYPPKPINDGLTKLIATAHPDLHYIANSASDVVSGRGPYQAFPPKFYFEQRATEKLHSEIGMPNIVTTNSLRQMMPESDVWPQGDVWGMHDFTLNGAQNGASYRSLLEGTYGPADSAADWIKLAQLVNYDGYRAMFEAQSKNRMGVLLWMTHPAWPSFVWQTYDYYFDPTAAYFGSKKASEPLHIQWNPFTDNVEVVNYSGGNVNGLTAAVEIRNMNGTLQWQKSVMLESHEDTVESPIKLDYPATLSPVHFIRLSLKRGDNSLSENFYLRGQDEGNLRAIRTLPQVKVDAETRVEKKGSHWLLTTVLANPSTAPALMVRVNAVREKGGDRILPAVYSDNYVALMPGEKRTISVDLEDRDTRGERPTIVVEGFNVP